MTARLANLAFAASAAPAALGFRRALGRVRETQTRLLGACLARNADTEVGRRWGFAGLRSVEDFQRRVPPSSWDDLEDDVRRIAAGARGVLTKEPVRLLEWSSGSTRAAKLVPYTDSLQAELRRAVGAWVADLFLRSPALAGGPAYWSLSPAHDPPRVEGAVLPIGFLEDAQYLGGRLARVVDATLAVPGAVGRIRDPELHRRVTLAALLGCRELRLISVWHPSFLTLLAGSLGERWDELLPLVASGLVLEAGLGLPARPERARELDRLGPRDLGALWPRLGLVSCWTDGPARRFLPRVRELFPDVPIQGKGLLATEGVVTIPFGGRRPLAVTSHFFELLDGEGRARTAWEVEDGHVYSLLLTTGGGLYRYRLGDRVRVTGFAGQAPCLEFLCKEDHVSDLCGEKLSEGFVQATVDGLLSRHRLAAGFALLAPETEGLSARYVLFLAPAPDGSPAPSRARVRELARDLEARLAENPHYALAVRLGQLDPAAVVPVGGDAPLRYLTRLAAEGQRLGDVKPTALSPRSGWRAWLVEARPNPAAPVGVAPDARAETVGGTR
jgi:hypothetical protein